MTVVYIGSVRLCSFIQSVSLSPFLFSFFNSTKHLLHPAGGYSVAFARKVILLVWQLIRRALERSLPWGNDWLTISSSAILLPLPGLSLNYCRFFCYDFRISFYMIWSQPLISHTFFLLKKKKTLFRLLRIIHRSLIQFTSLDSRYC